MSETPGAPTVGNPDREGSTRPLTRAECVAGAGYPAAHSAAAWLDRSDRVHIEFSGVQAAATLNGLVTNDVLKLKPGMGQYAAALAPKGKVIADVRVFALASSLLVDVDAAAAPGLLAMLRKFVNPRFATFRDVTAETSATGVFGPQAATVVAAITHTDHAAVTDLAAFAHVHGEHAGTPVRVVRVPDLGLPGYEIVGPVAIRAAVVGALANAGVLALDPASAEVLRIEAGRPRYGLDFDDSQLAQEVGLDRLSAISFDKGCYTGQETVVRVQHRGHVNRTLRGLRATTPLLPGVPLHGVDSAVVGDVRSAALSPHFGHIALAYVRREVADGDTVRLRATPATVSPLPFG